MFTIPDNKGRITQPNEGNARSNVLMSYGLDLETNKGKIGVSEQVKKLVNTTDNADFAGYAAAILAYSDNGSTGKLFAISDKAFSASYADPLGTWSEETVGSEPDSGNTVMDAVYFDGLVLVSESNDIKSWNGTTWTSWWQTTLGQSALVSGERHLMKVGSDGNLYIVDDGRKVYRVTPTGTITKTGNGSLDYSATNLELTCMAVTSTRLFIGTKDLTGDEATIIEWDMSPSASTANKLHKIGAKSVPCIAVWNDTPIAILSDGKVKYFNGASFVEFDKTNIKFPVGTGYELDEDFIHPNGWAIIDNLPHFLVTGRTDTSVTLTSTKQSDYRMPAGVWCLDPSIGLYHRYALGTGLTPQEDYGKIGISAVGALYSLQKTESKFLASYEYYPDNEGAAISVLAYQDNTNTQPSRGYLMTPFVLNLKAVAKNIESYHQRMVTGESMNIYWRSEEQNALAQSATWASTTQANIVGINLGITRGDVAFVKMGNGSGQLLRVDSVNESSATTAITFTEANTFVTAGDLGAFDFLNFKFIGTIDDTTRDYHTFNYPTTEQKRRVQLLVEFRQAANNKMELDYLISS